MTINVTLSLPELVINRIDKERGDINRSRYITRLLEQSLQKCLQQQYENRVSGSLTQDAAEAAE
jgi:metal-responsive CopG/Arc/MetJ family transcriptional regulator